MTMIEIDGSAGEGGGQILRTSLALSMYTGTSIRISNIRAGRSKPGLMRQHLACVHAARQISNATVSGAEIGSLTLTFEPGAVCAGDYTFSVGSAGSCMLVMQTVLPALMVAKNQSNLTLSGGTHNPLAPCFHFVERAFSPLMKRLGVDFEMSLRRHGFYPAGGGELSVEIKPTTGGLIPFDLISRGAPGRSFAESLAPALPKDIASKELAFIGQAFGWGPDQLITPPMRQNEGPGNALMITLAHENVTEVFASFGRRGLSFQQVAMSVIAESSAYAHNSAAVGPHLADQLALPFAMAVCATGRPSSYSCTEITEHTRTNLDVIARFLPLQSSVESIGTGWLIRLHRRSALD